ncbi:MAG: nucleotide pyrophosphatase/phosphodiesterase family protein [Nakamurella sp.]
MTQSPVVPQYGPGTLGAVLPGLAAALNVDTGQPAIGFPQAERVCLVLIDGLGAELLAEAVADGHAPFLAGLMAADPLPGCTPTLRVGCPTTTATSMGSLGTGLPPGQHGLLGYQVRDPARGVLVNELRWDPYTDPIDWQPRRTVFSRLAAAGVEVTNIGAAEFAGSGLTMAAHRGADFIGFDELADRVDATVASMAKPGPRLTYLYWGAVDATGHEFGWRSANWTTELRKVDAQLARLAAALPAGTLLVVTADHGMVDVPASRRLDIAAQPELRRGIAILGGEPRLVQLYCRDAAPGAVAHVAARFADATGGQAWVRTRDQAIDEGWFGPVDERVRARIGDVLVAARGQFALIDSEIMSKRGLALIGHHGSLTEAEQLVPLLTLQA